MKRAASDCFIDTKLHFNCLCLNNDFIVHFIAMELLVNQVGNIPEMEGIQFHKLDIKLKEQRQIVISFPVGSLIKFVMP
jgi:hypothetical protein